ncbi:hypothetical protein Tco_0070591 [Tanacetum coccineum]
MPRPLSLKQFRKPAENILNGHSESYKVVGVLYDNPRHAMQNQNLKENHNRTWLEAGSKDVIYCGKDQKKELRDRKNAIDLDKSLRASME